VSLATFEIGDYDILLNDIEGDYATARGRATSAESLSPSNRFVGTGIAVPRVAELGIGLGGKAEHDHLAFTPRRCDPVCRLRGTDSQQRTS